MTVRELEPNVLWNHFADLNAVPRPSKKEERVIEFARSFGESLGLETMVDHVGNVIIKKPASSGMEDRAPVVMQSHLDMVHQKNADTDFDFDSQGIDMYVDEDWVKARGTTLGADNGIGVATIMSILSSTDIAHPAVEALFTIDEETGMTGAIGLEGGLLNGKFLLNLDTEEDNELTIGCAGGVDITLRSSFETTALTDDFKRFKIVVRGLKGGHSGVEIHLGRGNANKWMNRILWHLSENVDLKVCEIDGGGLRNAIPRESISIVAINKADVAAFEKVLAEQTAELLAEYSSTDPSAEVVYEEFGGDASAINPELQKALIATLYSCPNGIFRMSPEIKDLVQTSNNLARVLVKDGAMQIGCLTQKLSEFRAR